MSGARLTRGPRFLAVLSMMGLLGCGPQLRAVVGTVHQAPGDATVICTEAQQVSQAERILDMEVTSDCTTQGDLWVAVVAPRESRRERKVTITLIGGEKSPPQPQRVTLAFPAPKARPATVTVELRATCATAKPRAEVSCLLR